MFEGIPTSLPSAFPEVRMTPHPRYSHSRPDSPLELVLRTGRRRPPETRWRNGLLGISASGPGWASYYPLGRQAEEGGHGGETPHPGSGPAHRDTGGGARPGG